MKKLLVLSASVLMLFAAANTSQAWEKVAFVFCDSNTNRMLDLCDTPVEGVEVVVTNLGGNFLVSGTTDSNGVVVLQLQNFGDTSVDFITAESLPLGTTEVLPPFNEFTTCVCTQVVTNFFLIENTNCVVPPPPPVETNKCWLTGGGTIGPLKGKPDFSFGGVVLPGCKATAAGGGNWNVIDHVNKLHFKGTSIVHVDCGNLPGFPPGSKSPKTPFNFIDFSGSGTLKGIAGNKENFGPVFFFARAVDLGEPGKGVDMLYLRVYTGSGDTLLLISATPETPEVISPVVIRSGNLQLHISGCDKPPKALKPEKQQKPEKPHKGKK